MKKLLSKMGYQISGIIENLDAVNPELIFCKQLSYQPAKQLPKQAARQLVTKSE